MNSINQPVPSPFPTQNVYNTLDASQANTAARPGVIFPEISRITGTYTSDMISNPSARGVRLCLTIAPTGPATGTYALTVEVPDPADTTIWKPLLGTLATGLTGVGTGALTGAFLTVYPGLTGIADAGAVNGPVTINQHLGPRWRAKVVTTLATLTFSVGADYLL